MEFGGFENSKCLDSPNTLKLDPKCQRLLRENFFVVVMDTDEIVPQSAKDHSPDVAIDGSGSCMEVSTQEVEENGIVISKDEEVVVLETQEQSADRGGQKIA